MKKIIAGLIVILILLFIISLIFSKKSTNTQSQTQENPPLTDFTTTTVNTSQDNTRKIYPTLGVQAKQNEVKIVNAKFLSVDQAKRFQDARKKLPISTSDFDISYSPLLDQYFIAQKNTRAQTGINQFLSDSGLIDIKNNFPSLFAITTQPIDQAIQKAEDNFLKNTQRGKYAQFNSSTSSSTVDDLLNLADLLQNNPYLTDSQQAVDQTGQAPEQPVYKPGDTSTLDAIVTESSTKAGVPPDLIYDVAQKSCGAFVSLPSNKIRAYSVPGNGLPHDHICFDNHLDPSCCLGPMQFRKTTWMIYATSVDDIGGYTHQPIIENIRDSLYAASKKLKVDGGGGDLNSWTENQYKLALQNYNKSCDDIADPSYCSTVWQNYLNSK